MYSFLFVCSFLLILLFIYTCYGFKKHREKIRRTNETRRHTENLIARLEEERRNYIYSRYLQATLNYESENNLLATSVPFNDSLSYNNLPIELPTAPEVETFQTFQGSNSSNTSYTETQVIHQSQRTEQYELDLPPSYEECIGDFEVKQR